MLRQRGAHESVSLDCARRGGFSRKKRMAKMAVNSKKSQQFFVIFFGFFFMVAMSLIKSIPKSELNYLQSQGIKGLLD